METRKIAIKDLRPNKGQIPGVPENPRKWTDLELERLARSMEETPELVEARDCIVYPQDGKYIVLGGGIPGDVIRENKPLRNAEHPTMKPIPLIGKLVQNSSRIGGGVTDLFGGSGSTLMACEQLGRRCFTMEYDPKYCDVIVDRWETFTGQKAQKL